MTTALYRRYRPETFAEMIGQSQVTDPLMTALRGDRVGHAYLFSGPRGCGKTTSARILARCLNCAEGPTDTPCGVCPSCVELSRSGGGSLDVVEIDAASHNGVDDARDLRERATFAPSRDRYKIFILDEAHMVTPQGFNALLKLVEEPPEHVKFIFATTEPEKVLGTIRSRTHHYPFRLVPPAAMIEYVERLCAEEGVQVEQGVLGLVVRAGGGSPRDTLSLLDQLIAGSDASGEAGVVVSYERAVALLGYTHAALLDEIAEALAAGDAASAFPAVDRVVQTGQDPRRFVDDLLERLRDLIVIAAVGDGASAVLRGLPADELDRMRAQAASFGPARLSRTADLVSQALDDMTGATSPRLHLELMVARVLAGAPAAPPTTEAGSLSPSKGSAPAPDAGSLSPSKGAAAPDAGSLTPSKGSAPASDTSSDSDAGSPSPSQDAPAQPAPTGPVTFERVVAAWPAVLARLAEVSRASWLVATGTQPLAYDADTGVLTLGFASPADVPKFKGTKPGQGPSDHLRASIEQELGVTVKYLPAPLPPSDGGGSARPDSPTRPQPPASDRAGDDAPASGWANPMSSPEPVGDREQHGGAQGTAPTASAASAPAASAPASSSRQSAAAVTEWAVAPIPSSAPDAAPDGAASAPVAASVAAPARQQQFPVDEEPAEVEASASAPQPPVDGAIDAPRDGEASPYDDVPPYDDEPPYDPEYDPPHRDSPAPAPAPAAPAPPAPAPAAQQAAPAAPRSAPAPGGVERRGEAVIRQVLGATFLREEPYQPPTRFS
ncbi:DNA polymerase III subunit gamma and tau [Microbacterium sp. ARD32]|uniref:DNA polymerase III subunit gamma and tau n=1 Tax=Microbacterium sp. ARD32 TaxID=2962577 RepID=UPI0028826300|nr:DNA polymerase III subunit gamma and tau [Microbacterium sp. ARD32]MDT0158454.1 DNA polymerase III subunit gamma and tau [Microbacterium sp. ARD32]